MSEVNGKPFRGAVTPGSFASISRRWQRDDRIDLNLPRLLRFEPVDAQHPTTVALLCGPLVLFAVVGDDALPRPRLSELLAARQTERQWKTNIGSRAVTFLPYVGIAEQKYSMFLTLAA